MSISMSRRRGLLVAGSFVVLAAAVVPLAAQQQAPAPSSQIPPMSQGRPGFSPIDQTKVDRSKQDFNLKGHPVPPIATAVDKLPLDKIKLPAGFKAEVWSSGHPGARTMVMGDKGTMFMGSRIIGRVYAITDKGGKREATVIIQGLTQPNGLAFKDGSLYVFAINKVYRYDKIEDNLDKLAEPVELTKAYDLPDTIHHNWKYVAFGPDGKMYVQVGANCNICEINPGTHGQIRRYNADGTGMEIVARGVRNTVGFDWHPVTKELWFTDNGRDWAGNEGPEDELNRVAKGNEGAHFGFPYCHANGIADPGYQEAQSVRGRNVAGGADRAALGRARHQVLHRRHVPEGLQERRLHRAPWLMESREEVRL
jgi:glucose/arabinose dehydrogenase